MNEVCYGSTNRFNLEVPRRFQYVHRVKHVHARDDEFLYEEEDLLEDWLRCQVRSWTVGIGTVCEDGSGDLADDFVGNKHG